MEIIKIGILTFHRAHNYGAVLQAFALQSFLRSKGYNVEIIDYWPKYREGHYDLVKFREIFFSHNKKTLLTLIKEVLKAVLGFPYKWIKHVKFSRFIKKNFKIKKAFYDTGAKIPSDYDVIICGSDQIWRYNFRGCKGFDEVYFAKYPSTRKTVKISYAASVGDKDFDGPELTRFSELLKNFDFISVREHPLQQIIASIAPIEPSIVLDPVFLLTADQWRTMIRPTKVKRKYLLFYQLLTSQEAENLAKKIARERKLELIEIRGSHGFVNPFERKNIKHTIGPIDLIGLIAHADFVVSSSYHGILFSIIFQRQFFALGFEHKAHRIKSLLGDLKINGSFVEAKSNIQYEEINYEIVDSRLEGMKKISQLFLDKSIIKRSHSNVVLQS